MKSKVLAASVLATVLSASAFAADLPSIKAPLVVPPPPPLWTGFYVGANAGGILGGNPGLTSSGVDIYDDYYPAAAGAAGSERRRFWDRKRQQGIVQRRRAGWLQLPVQSQLPCWC